MGPSIHAQNSLCNNGQFSVCRFIRAILALPLLPAEEIEPTFTQPMLLPLYVSQSQTATIDVLKRYLTRNWIKQTQSIELSVHYAEVCTNNGAESYHKKLKILNQNTASKNLVIH